jgi:endonuclease YncB( thermonuclease family)
MISIVGPFAYVMLATALAAPAPPKSARVIAVYDGDTYTLSDGTKVRLHGVNTPELRPKEDYGIEARDAASALLLNKEVSLFYGETQMDGYGRLIASVQVEGTDIATHLLEQGLGHLFLIPPDIASDPFMKDAQKKARADRRGIWSTARYRGDLHITSFHANANGDDPSNVNGEYLRLCNVTDIEINVEGYKIRNGSGMAWVFPEMSIPSGHTVKVHSGEGRHQRDPSKQLAIYLGSVKPIWNNSYDHASIYDKSGKLQDSREHSPKQTPKR